MAILERGICLDLDQTMGDFRGINPSWQSRDEVRVKEMPKLRPDLKNVLQNFRSSGFHIAVSSARNIFSLLVALEKGGVINLIDKAFGRDSLNYSSMLVGKDYSEVIKHFNFTRSQPQSNMIIFGDNEWVDAPRNPDGIVFVCQQEGHLTTAFLWPQIINKLLENGQGNFRLGYDIIFNNSRKTEDTLPTGEYGTSMSEIRKYPLSSRVDLYLGNLAIHSNVITPTIMPVLR